MERECRRYGLDRERVAGMVEGNDPLAGEANPRHWWELLVAAGALAIFIWLARGAARQPIPFHAGWMGLLIAASLVCLAVCGWMLWKRTRFS